MRGHMAACLAELGGVGGRGGQWVGLAAGLAHSSALKDFGLWSVYLSVCSSIWIREWLAHSRPPDCLPTTEQLELCFILLYF